MFVASEMSRDHCHLWHDQLCAFWVIEGAMNDNWFDLYVEIRLTRSLLNGDVIIRDKGLRFISPKAVAATMYVGA
tara:strand:+ start:231 stop:455 length:225 start_codon:yes stop_codon:yes gene_type:complete